MTWVLVAKLDNIYDIIELASGGLDRAVA